MRPVAALAALVALLGVGAPAVPVAAIDYQPDRWDRLVVTIELGGQPVRLLLDTGAARTVLRVEPYAALGLPSFSMLGQHITGAGGRVPVRWGRIPNARLGECHLEDLPVLIADIGGVAGADGLIGVDWLAGLGMLQINLAEPSLAVGEC